MRGVGRVRGALDYLCTGLKASSPPPSVGGLDLNSSNSGCARLSSGVAPPLGVVKEEVAILVLGVGGNKLDGVQNYCDVQMLPCLGRRQSKIRSAFLFKISRAAR